MSKHEAALRELKSEVAYQGIFGRFHFCKTARGLFLLFSDNFLGLFKPAKWKSW